MFKFKQLKEGVRDWLLSDTDRQLNDISLEYSYADLRDATASFAKENRLGAGAAGAVYRGTLRGGTEVAVKVLIDNGTLGGFEDEVRVLSRFRHPNLVTLLGWGEHNTEKFLLYELLCGGDVSVRLQRAREGQEAFGWEHRLKVGLDAACGLSHMMNSNPKAFHRDIKPANILIDANGTAKMADFGLAGTIKDRGRQHLTVDQISGTPGYACPVYVQNGRVREQSEVYSFGIVLLELLVNLPPALAGPQGDIIYPLFQTIQPASPGSHGRLLANLDQFARWPRPVAEALGEMALQCVDYAPEKRPLFEHIVRGLRQLVAGNTSITPLGDGGKSHNVVAQPTPSRAAPAPAPQGIVPQVSTQPPPGETAHSSAKQRRSSQPDGTQRLAEVVFQCAHAEGVDLSAIHIAQRAVAFTLDGTWGQPQWIAAMGRQHQPEFFELLVQNKDLLQIISRAHFEISVDQSASALPVVRKLSGNPLLVDDRPLGQGETAAVQDRTQLSFCLPTNSDRRFLVLVLRLRSSGQVQQEGPHPAAAVTAQRRAGFDSRPVTAPPAQPGVGRSRSQGVVAGVLECVRAAGLNPTLLSPEERAIALLFDEPVEVGRQCTPVIFDRLLQAEPHWLAFISRTHCRVQLSNGAPPPSVRSEGSPPAFWLKVENLSTNPIFVSGRALVKGCSDALFEGGSLTFAAKGARDEETNFLEFTLRRARSVPA